MVEAWTSDGEELSNTLPRGEAASSVEGGASDGEDLSNTLCLEVRQLLLLEAWANV